MPNNPQPRRRTSERQTSEDRNSERRSSERRSSEHRSSEHRSSEHRSSEHRSSDDPPASRVDERMWPITLVLVALAVCVAGIIISNGDFGADGIVEHAKHLARNAWVQLGALVLIVGALLWFAVRVKNRMHVRRMQFSACVGLLLHIFMLVGLQYADAYVTEHVAQKPAVQRRPFKVVSLPSDGRQLTRRILEQGLNRPVVTDNEDNNVRMDRIPRQPDEPIPESAQSTPQAEPEMNTVEVVPTEIARADTSVAAPGQITPDQLIPNAIQRQSMPAPLPATEAVAEPTPVGGAAADGPQIEATASSRGQQAQVRMDGRAAMGPTPDSMATLARPDAARRTAGGGDSPTMSQTQLPARQPGQLAGPKAPALLEAPATAGTPSRPDTLEAANTRGRGQPSRATTIVQGGEPLGAGSGYSRPAAGGQAGTGQLARRTQGEGAPGVGVGTRQGATPFARRGTIVVDGGGGGGVGNDPVLLSGAGGSPDAGGIPGPVMEAPTGGTGRQRGGSPGRGTIGGPGSFGEPGAVGEPGSGAGTGNSSLAVRGNPGAGGSGLGNGFGQSPRVGDGAGFGGIGKSSGTGLSGNTDGDDGGLGGGLVAGNTTGGGGTGVGSGRGAASPGPQESAGSSVGTRRAAALPGGPGGLGGPGGSGGAGGTGGSGFGAGSGVGGAGIGPGGGGEGGQGTGGGGTSLAGVPSRRTLPQTETFGGGGGGRFILDKSSSGPSLDARADPAPAFRQRGREGRGKLAESLGGSAESERAVELGLDFLARHRADDGHWGLHDFAAGRPGYQSAGEGTIEADTAATGIALLAFLGAGYSHFDDRHGQTVDGALRYLIRHQKADGDLFVGGSPNVWLYSHGIASIALCEAYGMTRDEKLREPAQKCLDFIIAAQHKKFGGWRYAPQSESDTSVSGWQMMALKSGELAGLKVPPSAYAGVSKWLDSAQARNDASRYSYLPGSQHAHQREPSRAMTAESLLMRLYLGWDRTNPNVVRGADYLQQNLPQIGRRDAPMRDTYYWYYATQVMFQMQGEHWKAWNGQLRPLLVDSQVLEGPFAGSWEPKGSIPDRWGDAGGRLYVTAINLLMLEVYYRHLPLYKTLTESSAAN